MSSHDNPPPKIIEDEPKTEKPKSGAAFAIEDEPEEEKLPPELEAKMLEIKERGNRAKAELRKRLEDSIRKTEGWDASDSPFQKEMASKVKWVAKRFEKAWPEWFLLPRFTESVEKVADTLRERIVMVEKYNTSPDMEKNDINTKERLSRILAAPLENQWIFTKPGSLLDEFGVWDAKGMARDELEKEKKK